MMNDNDERRDSAGDGKERVGARTGESADRSGNAAARVRAIMRIKLSLVLLAVGVALFFMTARSDAQRYEGQERKSGNSGKGGKGGKNVPESERQTDAHAQLMLEEGKQTFRFDTFGDEAFWSDSLQLHKAIAGAQLGGVGPGVSPRTALSVGLKVDVDVSIPAESQDRRTPLMAKPEFDADPRRFIIIGAGAAGYSAAQTLREEGFRGRIVMITRENRLPYDRPNLSKDYLQGHAEPEWMPLRPAEFFAGQGIEIIREKEVLRVDAGARTISLDDGQTLGYDALLVATGGSPVRLNIPGSDLKNIFVLRSFDDADSIIETAQRSQRAVVVGASFIGMEAAYSLAERGLEVTVVAPSGEPFERTLGAEVGALFRRLHESHHVRFKLGSIVHRFEGSTHVQAVVLESGERLETDMVVAGVGVHPATGFLNGVELDDNGGVLVDAQLRAAADLYAAGDIACYPDARTGERVRIEHWRTAQQQGRVAAHNMLGRAIPFDGVPFFWTRQFDAGLLYVGHASAWDEIIYQGEVASCDFLAFYAKDGRVLAVAGMNRERDMAAVEELFRLNRMPTPAQLKERATDFVALLGNAARQGGKDDGVGERAA